MRAHPLVLAVVLFLASELMFFAGLFATYFDLRTTAGVWPQPGARLNVPEATFGTFLLFLSSVLMFLVTRAMDRENFSAARRWLATVLVCAAGFVVVAIHGYSRETFSISSSAYGSIYYAMTGFHLLHVCAGIALLLALMVGMRSQALLVNCRAGAEAMTYYWHFVFVVWLGIFATIYFIR